MHKGLLAAAVASVFLFQAGNMGLAAYMLGLARHAGLGAGYASTALGVATWIGIVGSGLVVAFGTRFGRTWPLAVSAGITVLGTLAFHWSGSAVVYLVANCMTAVTWSFAIAYLLGMCAAFDHTGRAAALGGFLSKMGLASVTVCRRLAARCRRLRDAGQRLGDRARREPARDAGARARARRASYCRQVIVAASALITSVCGLRRP